MLGLLYLFNDFTGKATLLMVFQANFHGRGDGVVLTSNKTSRDMPLSEVTFLCGLTIMGLFL